MVGSMVRMIILVMRKLTKQHTLTNQIKLIKIPTNPLLQPFIFLLITLINLISSHLQQLHIDLFII
uniref:hypothetical protein n=1 Tax=Staphylococcus epidermidis TaxID=1282 RepID=UPI001C92E21E